MINIIIHGCNGRMGQVISEMAAASPQFSVVAGVDKFIDVRINDYPVYPELSLVKEKADVIIDFSIAAAVPAMLLSARKLNLPVVVATTALNDNTIRMIEDEISGDVAIFRAANMSLGINVMIELLKKATAIMGDLCDIEIIEKHHNQKIDAPSGTALALARVINDVFMNNKRFVYGRNTSTTKRSHDEIGIHAIRGGSFPGEHEVIFAGQDEVLEIKHIAYSRQIFGAGALAAARYIVDKQPGYYSMHDMVTETSVVTSILAHGNEAMITVRGVDILKGDTVKIFNILGDGNISIDMICQSSPLSGKADVSFTLSKKDIDRAVSLVRSVVDLSDDNIIVIYNISKLVVEGAGMISKSGVAAGVFEALDEEGVGIMAIATSETVISCVIESSDEKRALAAVSIKYGL